MKKHVFFIFLIFITLISSGQVPTIKYLPKSQYITNYIDDYNIGKTSYQIDRSTTIYKITDKNSGYIYNAYYYYVWFYNESIKNGYKSSTYIQSIDVYIDNQFIDKYWLLITGDYYYLTFYSVNPNAKIQIELSKPLPY